MLLKDERLCFVHTKKNTTPERRQRKRKRKTRVSGIPKEPSPVLGTDSSYSDAVKKCTFTRKGFI
jgi:hypothetical protein